MKGFLISAVLGFLALGAVNLSGQLTGVFLPVSCLSLGVSGALGIPGVTLMIVLNTIL